jgi:hypothetical protein
MNALLIALSPFIVILFIWFMGWIMDVGDLYLERKRRDL